jgi:signal transduction histidine kinase
MKDRFWRKHKARVAVGHSGLGLALVEALAHIMDLKVNLHLDDERDFLVTISGLSAA